MSQTTNILLCRCEHFNVVPAETLSAVRDALTHMACDVTEVGDLCGLAAARDERLARLVASAPAAVVACYPRAVKWLFAAAGVPLNGQGVQLLNMRVQSPEEIIAALSADVPPADVHPSTADAPDTAPPAAPIPADWKPWFPVLDYDRCIDCGQCMSFCLFGVYDLDADGRVVVAQPANCKTNCPACARVCPQGAIMFPKHAQTPINGAEPSADDQAPAPVNVADALGSDVYAALRNRGKTPRFAPKDARQQAEAERCRCAGLKKMQEELGVPQDVIDALRAQPCPNDCGCEQTPEGWGECGPDCACHDEPPETVEDCGPDCACHDDASATTPPDPQAQA